MSEIKSWVKVATESVITDLSDRKGFRQLLESIDPETMQDIRDSIESCILLAYRGVDI